MAVQDDVQHLADNHHVNNTGGEYLLWRPTGSPLARFRRMPAIRRGRRPYPLNPQEVQLDRASNLNSILVGHRPLLPELVINQHMQALDDALAVLHNDVQNTEGGLSDRLV